MKRLLLLFTLLSSSLFAQDSGWFQTGATWTYNYTINGMNWPQPTGVHLADFSITEQTELNGQSCAKMEASGDNPNPLGCNATTPPYYLFESNDLIFFANDYDNTFRLAYDFGAEVGDSWEFVVPVELYESETYYTVTVVAISSIEIDGQDLKVMTLDYNQDESNEPDSFLGFQEITVIERLGASFPFFIPFGQWAVCEHHFNDQLQCYNDPEISYLSPDFQSCALSSNDPEVSARIEISPNPASDFIKIESLDSPISEIRIYTITGQLVYSETAQKQEHRVNTAVFESGLYLISVETEKGIGIKKLAVD